MSKITQTTPWSTILKPAPNSPQWMGKDTRGIFLGWDRTGKFVKVVIEPYSTASTYAPAFWSVDDDYMSKREQIAELTGRIYESNEPTDIEDYRREVEDLKHELGAKS